MYMVFLLILTNVAICSICSIMASGKSTSSSRTPFIIHPVVNSYFNFDADRTVVGYGSLMSIKSARSTFPELRNFRTVKLKGYRRVFGHSPNFFFRTGIANLENRRMASLSVERADGCSFIGTAFSVNGISGEDFYRREEEYDFEIASFEEWGSSPFSGGGEGILCLRSDDKTFIERFGQEKFEQDYCSVGIECLWDWSYDSPLLPCSVYLRHCYLSAASHGQEVLDSFLDDTYLVDRSTTIRQYLEENPEVLQTLPPDSLAERYNG